MNLVLLGVGFPKCGTSWVASWFDKNPYFNLCTPKDSGYLTRDTVTLSEYLKYFDDLEKPCVDFSAGYCYEQFKVCTNLNRLNKTPKILFVIRSPMEKFYSEYLYDRKLSKNEISFSEYVNNTYGQSKCIYLDYIKSYISVFGVDNVKVLILEKVAVNPLEYYKELCDFIGTGSDYVPETINSKINAGGISRFLFLNRVLYLMRRVYQRYFFRPGGKRSVFVQSMTKLYKVIENVNLKPKDRSMMSSETYNLIKDSSYREIESLSDLLGIDLLAEWGYK